MTTGMEEARRLIAEEREKKTGFLDLGNLGLTEIPDELFELTDLEGLNLGSVYVDPAGNYAKPGSIGFNFIADLPDKIERLAGLSFLSLQQTQVANLEPLRALPVLRLLNCSFTHLGWSIERRALSDGGSFSNTGPRAASSRAASSARRFVARVNAVNPRSTSTSGARRLTRPRLA